MDSSQLRPIQQQAIALLMQGKPQIEVAEILQVDRITIGRWIQQPEFSSALSTEMTKVQDQVNQRLRESQTKALDTIEAILEGDDSSDRTRLDAAKFIIDRARALPDLPEPPPTQGIPASEVLALLDDNISTLDHQAGLLFEIMGLGTVDDWLAMNDFEHIIWSIAFQSVATYRETGEFWKPDPDDLLITELRRLHREHPEQIEAAQRQNSQTYYVAIAEIEGKERDRQHPDPGGDVATAVEA